jgi:hypothetical protein
MLRSTVAIQIHETQVVSKDEHNVRRLSDRFGGMIETHRRKQNQQ